MDMWLLAAQLTMGGVGTPSLTTTNAVATLPLELEARRCAASLADASIEAVCSPPSMAAIAALGEPPALRPRSMSTAAALWPRPEQMMTPRSPALPQGHERLKPVTGSQLYQFRVAVLQAGEPYAQAVPYRYLSQWQRAFDSPTHEQWQGLLAAEAATMARRQGQAPLTVLVGDSLALWLPVDDLPADQLWLNQSISGETTAHMRRRLHYFATTRPTAIHLMAGINDLKQGATEAEVIDNLYQILTQLKQQHPQARLVVYSILPTRRRDLPSDRIQRVNHLLVTLARSQGATFVDLHPTFSDDQGQLRADLTTDGLHLSPQGYTLWRAALVNP